MLFIRIEFVLGILIGTFQTNHAFQLIPVAKDHNISLPYIVDKNCTHVTFGFDVQYLEYPTNFVIAIYMLFTKTTLASMGETSFYHPGEFFLTLDDDRRFTKYTSLRADPIPKTWRDKHTVYVTFRFPNDRNEYRLALSGVFTVSIDDYLKSPFNTGKSRDTFVYKHSNAVVFNLGLRTRSGFLILSGGCFPQDDIAGCDPYCVCDTVVTKKCPDGSSIKGKCLDFESLTDNLANYTFNEACDSSSQTKLSSRPSSTGSFSSIPSSSGSFTFKPSSSTESQRKSFAASQSFELIIGIVVRTVLALGIILSLNFFRKKKKEFHSSLPDGSETKLYKNLNSTI